MTINLRSALTGGASKAAERTTVARRADRRRGSTRTAEGRERVNVSPLAAFRGPVPSPAAGKEITRGGRAE